MDFAAHMAPAGDLDQWWIAAGFGRLVEPIEPAVAVGVQEALAGAEQHLRMDALTIWRIEVERRRRRIRSPGPLVAHGDPEPPGFGLAVAGCEHRDGAIVGV